MSYVLFACFRFVFQKNIVSVYKKITQDGEAADKCHEGWQIHESHRSGQVRSPLRFSVFSAVLRSRIRIGRIRMFLGLLDPGPDLLVLL